MKPPVRFPDAVRRDLESHRVGLADEFEQRMRTLARPCIAVTSRRVANAPLRRSPLAKLFGARTSPPVLDVVVSKFGGTPYCDSVEDWREHAFLGQILLSEATAVLPEEAPRLRGLLRLDVSREGRFRVRWFPEPSETRAVTPTPLPISIATWETRLVFAQSWTLPEGNELEALWPLRDVALYEYEKFDPPGYHTDGFDEHHRMLGHKSSGLDEHYGFEPPPGCSGNIADYESLLRLTFDNEAGFQWGTNWIYLLVPRADLAAGELGRIVVTGANS